MLRSWHLFTAQNVDSSGKKRTYSKITSRLYHQPLEAWKFPLPFCTNMDSGGKMGLDILDLNVPERLLL